MGDVGKSTRWKKICPLYITARVEWCLSPWRRGHIIKERVFQGSYHLYLSDNKYRNSFVVLIQSKGSTKPKIYKKTTRVTIYSLNPCGVRVYCSSFGHFPVKPKSFCLHTISMYYLDKKQLYDFYANNIIISPKNQISLQITLRCLMDQVKFGQARWIQIWWVHIFS